MKKIILNPNICIDEIEVAIKKQGWEIIEKKYDFYQSYVSTFDGLNYEAKVDLYIAFRTAGNFIHKIYCYFLEFDTDNIFKISEIKSPEHPKGQMTTRIAAFKYYKTTGNLGFSPYKSPVSGQPYNLSHNYHSFFNSLLATEARNELNYVCILLKYDNHAQSKKRLRYFVNSYKKFIKSFIFKFEKFESNKTRVLLKAEMLKRQKKKITKKVTKSLANDNFLAETIQKVDKKNIKVKQETTKIITKKDVTTTKPVKTKAKLDVTESNNAKTVISKGNIKTIFDHKNMTVKIIKKPIVAEKSIVKLKTKDRKEKK
ncbi:hypothetical protein [Spiroplasma endosymbiont of Polydrusus pterygomalis]|uniref:hypothetical protein n=1 Tax=Spiroplasma endosymbiont of Polydrusus pterygomalis TaxID=3139327 RepID=UPI003CCAD109